jgi:trimethylamine:corrinoid methyltransferase-like protein
VAGQLLGAYERPPINESVEAELKEYVEKMKQEINEK